MRCAKRSAPPTDDVTDRVVLAAGRVEHGAHFLAFDLEWHRVAVAELLRVARGEVRLYPTNGGVDADVHPFVVALVDDWRERRDIVSSFHESGYEEGIRGANRFLRIRRVG